MKKKITSYFLLLVVLVQSCVVYQKTPVHINEATNKGTVKVESTTSRYYKFNSIIKANGEYYGIKNNYDSIRLYPEQVRNVFLLKNEEHKIYRIVIKLNNKDKVKGYLVGLEDSALVISYYRNIDFTIPNNQDIYTIREIDEIQFRRNGKQLKSTAIGLGVGFSLGAFIGYQDNKNDSGTGASLITNEENVIYSGILIALIGGIIGIIAGSIYDEEFFIDGIQWRYADVQDDLQQYVIK